MQQFLMNRNALGTFGPQFFNQALPGLTDRAQIMALLEQLKELLVMLALSNRGGRGRPRGGQATQGGGGATGATGGRAGDAAATTNHGPNMIQAESPASADGLPNGSFDKGWATHNPTGNQAPAGWSVSWKDDGHNAPPEMVHKLSSQLPPDEQRGAEKALIRDGDATYKVFNGGQPFDATMRTTVSVPEGQRGQLTIPVQTHDHAGGGDPNAFVEVKVNGEVVARATAAQMGDRRWHELQVPLGPGDNQIEINMVSHGGGRDFFVDGIGVQTSPAAHRRAFQVVHPTA